MKLTLRWANAVLQFNPGPEGSDLLESIESNTRRYQSMFAEAADDLMQDLTLFPPSQLHSAPRDVFDVMRAQVSHHTFTPPAFGELYGVICCIPTPFVSTLFASVSCSPAAPNDYI